MLITQGTSGYTAHRLSGNHIDTPSAKMPSPDSESPEESYFNDLTQQTPGPNAERQSPAQPSGQDAPNDNAAKQKRIACVLCRKRKLRCDGARPTCATCKRLSHDCAYDEVRKKSGPKRGYVKLLEQRLRKLMRYSAHPTLLIAALQNKSRRSSKARNRPKRLKTRPGKTRPRPTLPTPFNKARQPRERSRRTRLIPR